METSTKTVLENYNSQKKAQLQGVNGILLKYNLK